MPNFKYDRAIGSFRAWLMNMTRWRIADQFRKRTLVRHLSRENNFAGDAAMDGIADPSDTALDALWNEEWKQALLEAAMAKVKRNIDPQQYQIFDLYVNKGWEPSKVAEAYGVAIGQVYLTKSRVTKVIKEKVERMQRTDRLMA